MKVPAKALGQHFCRFHNVDPAKLLDVVQVATTDLISLDRLDIIPKLLFAEALLYDRRALRPAYFEMPQRLQLGKAMSAYVESIRALSHGTFEEPGNPEKNSPDKYIHAFIDTVDDLQRHGFDPSRSIIPVSIRRATMTPLDGAHRIAALFALRAPKAIVAIVRQSNWDPRLNHRYFLRRGVDEALVRDWLRHLIALRPYEVALYPLHVGEFWAKSMIALDLPLRPRRAFSVRIQTKESRRNDLSAYRRRLIGQLQTVLDQNTMSVLHGHLNQDSTKNRPFERATAVFTPHVHRDTASSPCRLKGSERFSGPARFGGVVHQNGGIVNAIAADVLGSPT